MTSPLSFDSMVDIYSPVLYVSTFVNLSVFLGVGVWSLHHRFRQFSEWSVRTQAVTMLALLVFFTVEIMALRSLLEDNVVYFIFAVLGLLVAGLALYGHIAVSLLSRLLVELVVPDYPGAGDIPRLGPAEALEKQGDWEGALNEYYILARVYPGNATLCVRVANNLSRLQRKGEAAQWFERALKYVRNPDEFLSLTRRLADTYEEIGEPERARAALSRFVARHPDHPSAGQLGERPVSTASSPPSTAGPCSEKLSPMEACHSLSETVPPEDIPLKGSALQSLHDVGVVEPQLEATSEPGEDAASPRVSSLSPLESAPIEGEDEVESSRNGHA